MRNLNDIFCGAARSVVVHLCVDLQNIYIGEDEKPIERRIGQEIAPVFSAVNIPTYWVYYDVPTLHAFHVGAYRGFSKSARDDLSSLIGRREGDLILPKQETSSMTSPQVNRALSKNGKKILLLSGFTYPVCVSDTAMDAVRAGYRVVLMEDATDFDPDLDIMRDQLESAGVFFVTSSQAIESVRSLTL